jgi:hypothetical protein
MREKKILIEFHGWRINYCANKILLKALKEKFKPNVEIDAYLTYPSFFSNTLYKNFIDSIILFLGTFFKIKTFKFYKLELNVNKIFKPKIKRKYKIRSEHFCEKFFKKKISKGQFFKLKINEIYIGDLLFDSYIKCNSEARVDVDSKEFKNFFRNFLSLFYFWEEYFKNNDVKAVITHHNTYLSGIPARIAVYKKAKCLIDQDFKLFQLTKKNLKPQLHVKDYKKNFDKFNSKFKKKALHRSNLLIDEKFKGSLRNVYYMLKTPFGKKFTKKRVIEKNKKFKIIIFPLSFYDSPSGYGGSLFYDFYDWLIFILKLSLKTNYDWYIKLHPDVLIKWDYMNYTIVKNILKDFKNIKWLAPSISHKQIINEGINAGLTVHGTVGSEYPYFNVPIVNASKNNPHMMYDFNYHPKTKKELEKIILKLPKIKKKKINKKEILEYFFMSQILPNYNWLGIDMRELIKNVKDKTTYFKSEDVYNLISKKVNEKKVLKSLKDFLNTDNYIFEKKYDKKTNFKDL